MKVFLVFLCLLAPSCLAQKPHPCTSPPLLTGALTVSTQNENLWSNANYQYDALEQRIYANETYQNKTRSVLLLYREAVMYVIDEKGQKCSKRPLKDDFHPLGIPKDASLLGQVFLGSSSGPGQGLLVNTWWGELPDNKGKYMSTVTEFGCFPVHSTYHSDQFGKRVTYIFFDNDIGILDPQKFNPPDFCEQAEADNTEDPADFFSLFINKQ